MEDIKLYWSRRPGKFVNKTTGKHIEALDSVFTGTVREWYECLVETIIDACNASYKQTGVGGHWGVKVSPSVACVLMCSVLFKTTSLKPAEHVYVGEKNGMKVFDLGIGQISNITVFEDNEQQRDEVIVGRLNSDDFVVNELKEHVASLKDVITGIHVTSVFEPVATVVVLNVDIM